MSTIYIGMHDRRARFHHERQKDDAPYVPLHELNAALEANRSLVRQMAGMWTKTTACTRDYWIGFVTGAVGMLLALALWTSL